ncbi:MAG: hypothetical protein HY551_08405 [Elusimicrobia bacterium]|nr:hypothetical protein [Elusimicrobiota bacterium]
MAIRIYSNRYGQFSVRAHTEGHRPSRPTTRLRYEQGAQVYLWRTDRRDLKTSKH